jgi:hypothetical protein
MFVFYFPVCVVGLRYLLSTVKLSFSSSRFSVIACPSTSLATSRFPFWEASNLSTGQEIPHLLWRTKLNYSAYRSPPLDPVLSQMKPFHVPTPYTFKICFNINLASTRMSFKWSFFFLGLPTKILYVFIISPLRAACSPLPPHTPWFDHAAPAIAPRILDLGIGWRWVVSFTFLPLYPQGKSPWYPFRRRLGEPQNRSDMVSKRNSQPTPGIEPWSSYRPARSQSLVVVNKNTAVIAVK